MSERPPLTKELDSGTFREYYYLKSELTDFCRVNGLPASGGKTELTERIAAFLDTGAILRTSPKQTASPPKNVSEITRESIIEAGFICSEKHRAFFQNEIGKGFSFNVPFQKWLKSNPGKTYGEAITAYHEIMAEKKNKKAAIDPQFEYNTYIRDFFADNAGKTLSDAIICWKYKKSQRGPNKYERSDLSALDR
jgi:hypothetical protein